jgi:hypothetical protein
MVIKEIWVYLLAYNLIRFLMEQAADAGILPREINFIHSLQLWLIWSRQADNTDENVCMMICALTVQE